MSLIHSSAIAWISLALVCVLSNFLRTSRNRGASSFRLALGSATAGIELTYLQIGRFPTRDEKDEMR